MPTRAWAWRPTFPQEKPFRTRRRGFAGRRRKLSSRSHTENCAWQVAGGLVPRVQPLGSIWMKSLIQRALPSAMQTWTPPGWRLRAPAHRWVRDSNPCRWPSGWGPGRTHGGIAEGDANLVAVPNILGSGLVALGPQSSPHQPPLQVETAGGRRPLPTCRGGHTSTMPARSSANIIVLCSPSMIWAVRTPQFDPQTPRSGGNPQLLPTCPGGHADIARPGDVPRATCDRIEVRQSAVGGVIAAGPMVAELLGGSAAHAIDPACR